MHCKPRDIKRPTRKNQLFTIKGGGHGGFAPEQNQQAYLAVRSFLRELRIVAPAK